jgi:hypothetical protein
MRTVLPAAAGRQASARRVQSRGQERVRGERTVVCETGKVDSWRWSFHFEGKEGRMGRRKNQERVDAEGRVFKSILTFV